MQNQTAESSRRLITRAEVCAILGRTYGSVSHLAATGRLEAHHRGPEGTWWYEREKVEAMRDELAGMKRHAKQSDGRIAAAVAAGMRSSKSVRQLVEELAEPPERIREIVRALAEPDEAIIPGPVFAELRGLLEGEGYGWSWARLSELVRAKIQDDRDELERRKARELQRGGPSQAAKPRKPAPSKRPR